jgi:glutamate racemase
VNVGGEHHPPNAGLAYAPRDPSAPVGVFDSGVGGLTVARELMRQLPDESIVYVGDTARVPYGPKSPETVRRYSREISAYLLDQGAKIIVIACNTATAHALVPLRAELPVPVVGVVEPGARAALADGGRLSHTPRRVGIIGTSGTVRSGAYERAIRAIEPDTDVIAQACPLFVPFVEEGWFDHEATRLVAHEYLDPMRDRCVDTLVLGCTHYPLLKALLAEVVGPNVRLIDSAEETAAETGRVLAAAGLRTPIGGASPRHRFVVTDAAEQFSRTASHFLGAPLHHVETLAFAS